ncbi:MAG: flagellar basal-body rod protein FlgF [Spirochaetes bacterium GWD1_27_9]|nr:MAG: flagellar basal-body rod protein FlgF [Spirochaetes bacterium GWB1_27_13]OHD25323.1 MAG: flagellar basal-body rod protein FlgF [Spirochaetes bacterium GWC1_27_15]OHD29567.1 MAG: flagellar basal-body rod protein FlgF [Spirochaetes bacterium GWD1_27_9]
MLRGIYTSASGMNVMQERLDIISNNLANVDLVGYKKDLVVMKEFPNIQIRRGNDDGLMAFPLGSYDKMPFVGKLGTGVELNESYTIFSQGSLKETNNDFDVALDGKGFIAVETEKGERYTRNGSFTIDKEGFLVTKDGLKVLTEEGPIQIKSNNFVIDKEGNIYQNNEFAGDPNRLVQKEENEWKETEKIGRLKIVRFPRERELRREGNSFYYENEFTGKPYIAEGNERPKIMEGFLESANVDPVIEMTQMIEVQRTYEANQKSIQSHDQLLGKIINEAGVAR